MFLGTYRLKGNPAHLKPAYDKLLGMIPHANLHLHVCVPDDQGLWIYDACPTKEVFTAFSTSADFHNALKAAGLPEPRVTPVGEVHAAFVGGKRAA
jgi:hypothetical protein